MAEFGGHGNVAAIATAMRAVGAFRNGNPELVTLWFFPTVEEYGALLRLHCERNRPRTASAPLKNGIERWLRTFVGG